jgi:hypothetical protein
MERSAVIAVLESLAAGKDPMTGTPVTHELFEQSDTVCALAAAVALLKDELRPSARSKDAKLTAAGTNWTEQEEALLCHEFDSGMTISAIAVQHGRTSGGITARLVKLGRLDPAAVKPRERGLALAVS